MLVIRDDPATPAVVAALAPHQLSDPEPVLRELGRLVENAPDIPVLLPRYALSLMLTRDVARDIATPATCLAMLRDDYPEPMVNTYAEFLKLAAEHESRREPMRVLCEALDSIGRDPLHGLEQYAPGLSADALVILRELVHRAASADDQEQFAFLLAVQHAVLQVRAGELPADVLAGTVSRSDSGDPAWEALSAAAESENDDIAVPALRDLRQVALMTDRSAMRREVACDLAQRLLLRGGPDGREEAIVVLEEARSLSSERDELWIRITGNLAAAYGQRTQGDVLDNWANAVALAREVVQAPDSNPRSRALNRTNLGLALVERPGGSTFEDLAEALDWLYKGLADRSPDKHLTEWAYSKINVGLAHRRRGTGDDVTLAVTHFSDALSRLRGSADHRLIAYAALNLANALLAGEPVDGLAVHRALSEGEAAVAALAEPFMTAWAAQLRGNFHAHRDGPRSADAVASWRRGIDALDPVLEPATILDHGVPLLTAYVEEQDWPNAADIAVQLLAASTTLFDMQGTTNSRRHVTSEHPLLVRTTAYCLARAGHLIDAVQAVETGRVRDLGFSVARDVEIELDQLDNVRPDLAREYIAALTAYRTALATYRPASPRDKDSIRTLAIFRELRAAEDKIRRISGFETFATARTIEDTLRDSGANQVIHIITVPFGCLVLRTRLARGHLDVAAHWLEYPTSSDVANLLLFPDSNEAPGLLAAQFSAAPFDRAVHRLQSALAPLTTLIADIVASAGGVTVLVPTGLLGLVPLHALADEQGQMVDDVAAFHLAPSLAVYTAGRQRARRRVGSTFVAVADTDAMDPLPGSRAEVETIASHPRWQQAWVALGDEATVEWLVTHAGSASHLHLACHGTNDLTDPDGNHLVLGQGEALSVPVLAANVRLRARVAVASACQSGHYVLHRGPDELVGLAAGLLNAGAACAVVSLWPVDDEATALLMTRFYELLLSDGLPTHEQRPQEALRLARIWLRTVSADERDHFINSRPHLASALRRRGVVCRGPRADGTLFGAVIDWGAFVAYGA